MVRLLFLLLIITSSAMAQDGAAIITKINWQDGKVIDELKYERQSYFKIDEPGGMLNVGGKQYRFDNFMETDSVTTYDIVSEPNKVFIYLKKERCLVQKNVKYSESHGLETWFKYCLKNEFEL